MWAKDNQTQDVLETAPDVVLAGDFNAIVDIDKIDVQHTPGGGAEFGSGAQGIGVVSHRVIYNIESRGALPNEKSPATHVWGFQYIP